MATSCLSTLYVLVTVVVAIQARETLNFFSLVKSTTWTSTSTTTVVKTIPFCASLLEVEGPCLGHSSLPDIHPSSASKLAFCFVLIFVSIQQYLSQIQQYL